MRQKNDTSAVVTQYDTTATTALVGMVITHAQMMRAGNSGDSH